MRAFCPGHITGFFTIDISDPEPLKRGSRGIGFCVEVGVIAEVRIGEGDVITIRLNGQVSEAPVTGRGLELLLPEGERRVEVDIKLDAPIGQGFGMSAAGTFAACLALAEELGMPDPMNSALRAAHIAEVESGTGLGDAAAQSIGGFVRRSEPGPHPYGVLERIDWEPEDVVICILDDALSTASIISSAEKRHEINEVGGRCLAEFSDSGGVSEFTRVSRTFANDTGLATTKMKEALESISDLGEGGVVMLGNAVFAFGEVDVLTKELAAF
jgi:pantoate kinase